MVIATREAGEVGPDSPPAVVLDDGTAVESKLVLVAAGGGRPARQLGGCDFESYSYWDNGDPLFALRADNRGKSVLLAGGGDGGLNDFVRLITGEDFIGGFLRSLVAAGPQDRQGWPVVTKLLEDYNAHWKGFRSSTNHAGDRRWSRGSQQFLLALTNRLWGYSSVGHFLHAKP